MKIIAHIPYGYLVAMTASELSKITGNPAHSGLPESNYDKGPRLEINKEVEVCKTWDHLQKLTRSPDDRKRIAESLRAAATLVEHTPDPLTVSNSSGYGYFPVIPTT